MLFDYRFQYRSSEQGLFRRCDLMLFDYRFQSAPPVQYLPGGCDLMLFDYRFQFALVRHRCKRVVI